MKARFDFDTKPFIQGLDQIGGKLDNIQGRMGGLGKVIAQGAGRALSGLIAKIGGIAAGFASARAILNEMPEVGEAFGIAKDIFMKNFTWPLRQQVMPLLQKMLNWVRDHRTTFVKWGVVVVGVFKTACVAAKILWDAISGIGKALFSGMLGPLDKGGKKIQDFINLALFKLAALTIFMSQTIAGVLDDFRPAFEEIGKLIGGVWRLITSFFEGMSKDKGGDGIKALSAAFTNLLTNINKLVDSKGAKLLAEWSGQAFASGLRQTVDVFARLVDTLATLLSLDFKKITDWFGDTENYNPLMKTDWGKGLKEGTDSFDRWFGGKLEKAFGLKPGTLGGEVKSAGNVQDAIITKDGKVIRTDPDDNIFATKGSPMSAGGSFSLEIPVQVYVTEGNARRAGVEFAEGVASRGAELRAALLQTMRLRGA